MKKTAFYIIAIFLFSAFKADTPPTLDKNEAKLAFEFLNKVRTQPQLFQQSLQLSPQLKIKKTALIWNDTLAKVAEKKAMDMAVRNYFDHTDPDGNGINYHIRKSGYALSKEWTKDRTNNFFESIGAGIETGEEAITQFIIDKDTPSFGHRNHLLGVTEWYGSLVDIGIGFARAPGSEYESYICVIIAKHH